MKWSKLFLVAVALMAVAPFTSCGDDDDHASIPTRPSGENEADSIAIAQIAWQEREIRDGVVSRTAQVQKLFDYPQTISMLEIDLNKADVSFVVSYEVSLSKTTSDRAIAANALAAINGTFFNTSTGVSRHFLKCNGTVVATTETNEFSTRATGAFCATGDRVEIKTWSSSEEASLGGDYQQVVVSGPLMMDNGHDVAMWANSFTTDTHPRTCVATTDDNRVLFIVFDGRLDGAKGVNLYDLRTFARQMGATDALNLDGGGSSTLYIQSYGVINHPCDNGKYDHEGERAVPSVLMVKTN